MTALSSGCRTVLLFTALCCGAGQLWAGEDGATALIDAVRNENVGAVRALLRRNADVNAVDATGTTALHWAAHRNNLLLVDVLLRAGAKATTRNDYGATPLSVASEAATGSIAERLLEAGADPNTILPGGETALMTAARGNADAVRVLLAHGANPNATTELRKQTALMWAAADGNVPALDALVRAGADMSARAKDPSAALAARLENQRVIQGGRTDDRQKITSEAMRDGFTPLLFAVRAGHREAVQALLDLGARIDESVPDGTTPLLVAAINAHWELAAYLLERGANPHAVGGGATALHLIARQRTLRYMININGLPPPAATGSISSLDLVKRLVARGANVNAQAMQSGGGMGGGAGIPAGATPLIVAASPADPELMRLLLANGADPRIAAADGSTVVMVAAGSNLRTQTVGDEEDAYEALKIALAAGGGDVNAVNAAGDTALHAAAFRGFNPIAQTLVDHGARLDARNAQGRLPVEVAHAEFRIVMTAHRPETEALLTRLMEERGIPVPRQLTREEFEERYVRRGPVITCPAPPPATAPDGRPLRVVFDPPTAIDPTDGRPASVTLSCTPDTGSEFPAGSTTVTCTATDRFGRTDSCRFAVHVSGGHATIPGKAR